MFAFSGSPVAVRPDVVFAFRSLWHHLARPGLGLTGAQRVGLLGSARRSAAAVEASELGVAAETGRLVDAVYRDPASVGEAMVRAAADVDGDPRVVEVGALVSMLSAVDGVHRALGVTLEPLPEAVPGNAAGTVRSDLRRRRTHLPVPPGPIPVVFDMLPMEGAVFRSLFGPLYMTDHEMELPRFARSPGLDRAQMEVVSSRVSLLNECFY